MSANGYRLRDILYEAIHDNKVKIGKYKTRPQAAIIKAINDALTGDDGKFVPVAQEWKEFVNTQRRFKNSKNRMTKPYQEGADQGFPIGLGEKAEKQYYEYVSAVVGSIAQRIYGDPISEKYISSSNDYIQGDLSQDLEIKEAFDKILESPLVKQSGLVKKDLPEAYRLSEDLSDSSEPALSSGLSGDDDSESSEYQEDPPAEAPSVEDPPSEAPSVAGDSFDDKSVDDDHLAKIKIKFKIFNEIFNGVKIDLIFKDHAAFRASAVSQIKIGSEQDVEKAFDEILVNKAVIKLNEIVI